ncbi:MAG: sulfite exporter TauE/SafE family protein [Propionibacteriaceae bacterium]|nr:sulfite exporter TauE/SafE family protein [Propionibacteriaceae bacterium]
MEVGAAEVGLAGALLGGILSLLSPCSVMLLPAFFAFAFNSPGKLFARAGVFYLGLITTLVPMGVLSGTVGAFVSQHRAAFVYTLSGLVIVFGLLLLSGLPLPSLPSGVLEGTSAASVYLLGTVYGLAGVCTGPLLGSVLALAAFGGSPLYGALVLLVFACGMVVPLLLLALLWERLPKLRDWLRPREFTIGKWHNTWTNAIAGLITIAIGILLIATEGTQTLAGVLTATDQFRLESWAQQVSAPIPNWAFALAAAAVLALIFGLHRFRGKPSR